MLGLRAIEFCTSGLPEKDQFDAWRERFHCMKDLTQPPGGSPGYAARFQMWSFGHFALTATASPPLHSRRTHAHIRRDSLDHWVIHVARRGTLTFRSQGAEASVSRGRPLIRSLDQVTEMERTEVDWLCLFVARDAFPDLGARIDECRAMPMQGAMAGLLASYLESLHQQLPLVTEAELPHLAEATRAVVAACLGAGAPLSPTGEAQVAQARLGRVRQLVRQNLTSARLGPERLAQMAGMSRSQLYRLFEPLGGVARYIQIERLARAHCCLTDPGNTESIQAISDGVGFFDPSAFSRAFRREFGQSPSAIRMRAAAGEVAWPRRERAARRPQNIAGALRHLGLGHSGLGQPRLGHSALAREHEPIVARAAEPLASHHQKLRDGGRL